MKVLHVIPSVAEVRGGPSVAIRAIAGGLARAGVTVHVATTDDDGPNRMQVDHGVPVVDEGVTYWYFPRQTQFYTFSWPLSRWLASNARAYDVTHIHALFSYAAIPAARSAARHSVPYVVRPLGTLNRWGMQRRARLKRLSFSLIERRIIAGASRLHFTSEQERIEAAELGVQSRPAVIPLGIDVDAIGPGRSRGWLRQRAEHLAGRDVLLFLGRLDPKKGVDLLLDAFARLRAGGANAALVIAGDGPAAFVASLQRRAASLGIADEVVWSGFLRGDEKIDALADADLFVLPSHSENFGIAVVEAMACGLPAVVSEQVAIQRDIAAARAGAVCACEADALARAIEPLLGDAQRRRRMGARARKLVVDRFSLNAMTRALVNMYSEITPAS